MNVWKDGGVRVAWMLAAWQQAEEWTHIAEGIPCLWMTEELGRTVEPIHNHKGIRDRLCPSPAVVRAHLPDLFQPDVLEQARNRLYLADYLVRGMGQSWLQWAREDWPDFVKGIQDADQWYVAFEYLHPFRDGNGRAGKILYNWLIGRLEDPVLMLDYFGSGVP